MPEGYSLVPVGRIRSSLTAPGKGPHQGRDAGTEAIVEVEGRYRTALEGVEGHDRLLVVCWLHAARRDCLRVHPRNDPSRPLTGVFATRSPARPNPLAVYTVDLLEVKGNLLRVRGVDAIDGTPVVDIRPHVPRLDE